nr:PREDICTED: LOW QUALITY PROTEIN: CMRF35-like molecule 2 [Pelecanus crispus]
MGILPGWGWLLLPVCQALVVPREVSGQVGGTLSLHCWYPRGYEGYNKYWCRGASQDSCHKVVETAGREVPRQRSRVSIQDSYTFCVVQLTMENLSEADAGSYWCRVERIGRDLMEPVTVRVVPAKPQPCEGENQPRSSPLTSRLRGPALRVLVPIVVLLSLLAAASSAGLLCALLRRREGLWGAPPSQRNRKPPPVSLLSGTLPPHTKFPAAPCKPGTAAQLDHGTTYNNDLDLAEVRAPDGQCGQCRQHGQGAMQ